MALLTGKQGEGEAGAVTGNSHHATANSANADGDVRNNKHSKEEEEGEEGGASGGGGHEKSVLQAKLTKLAIQIGYAGKAYRFKYLVCVYLIRLGIRVIN